MVNEPIDRGQAVGGATVFAHALVNHEFFLVYQPTIDLRTNALAGVEALIRWRHPTHGVIGPDQFLTSLETSGEIISVGRWTLVTACNQGAEWHARGYRFSVSVNVSSHQLDEPRLVDDVAIALASSRFNPESLILELTRSSLPRATERLEQIRELGVRLAIDDFDPRRSTLEELSEFGIDIVKLGRPFIASLANAGPATDSVRSVVELAKSLGVDVIATGIEDAEQRRQLQLGDVGTGQGFLFSEPCDAEAIDRLLEDFALFSGEPL